jgi:diguanylate cyclase (GGDEF)-like protein
MAAAHPIQIPSDFPAVAGAETSLQALIRADQLRTVRRTVLLSIPVNILLGIAAVLVAWQSGRGDTALIWFAASSVVNLLRIVLCRWPLAPSAAPGGFRNWSVDQHLRRQCILSLASGAVWALIPVLCDGYTSPQTLFYIALGCGITAGAVTHSFAYAPIPICFITLPLLSGIGCLVYVGGFDRYCLSLTVLLYLAALVRFSREGEALVRDSSRLKHQANALSQSLEVAHDQATGVAEEMRHRASHDALTGLLNRSGFLDEARRRLQADASQLCLMLLDLDGFKLINDAFGHREGDNVLIGVAGRLRQSLPEAFTVARLGGDEFAVLFDIDPARSPEALAATLIAATAAPFSALDKGRVGVSIGICKPPETDIDEMLVYADAAVYAAKSGGRNRFYVFDDELRARLEMRRDVERDLSKALAADALEVWYQPILGQGGRVLNSFEALVRWNHPKLGWIPPADLIAVASLAGLSEPLLRYILNDVCGMMQTLQAMELRHIRVAMNVSPREMSQIAVDELVLAKLKKHDLSPQMLEIEITEETAMDIRAVQGKLSALAAAGVQITIDDFGVGYSSLGALRQLHVNRVKIDRCFVSGIVRSDENQALVQAILNLARSFKLEVVAEGVETAEDLDKLRQLGCPAMQGYFLGRPQPKHDIIEWIGRLRRTEAAQAVVLFGPAAHASPFAAAPDDTPTLQ